MLNNNYQKILIKFGLWLATAFLIMLVGISGVFADTYTNIGDKSDITVILVSPDYLDTPVNIPKGSEYNFYNVVSVDIILNNYNFEANKNYQLELDLTMQTLTNANYYTVTGYNGERCLISYDRDKTHFDGQYPRWAFECPHSTNTVTITISNSNGQYLWEHQQTNIFKWVYSYLRYSTSSLSSVGNNTDDIINNQNQNTQSIINNQNQNTQDIIDNQNENTDRIIEENNKNFQTCINNLTDKITFIGGGIDSTGSFYLSPNYSSAYVDVSDYVGSKINIIRSALPLNYTRRYSYCFTSSLENSNCITYHFSDSPFSDNNITIPNNAKYLILHGYNQLKNENWFKNYVEINFVEPYCTNKLDDLNSSLTDSSPIDMNSLGNTAGWFPPGPIDSIINLPLNLFNNLLTALNSTCQPINIPLPYVDKNLPIPCISTIFNQIDGLPGFWNWVGAITSVVILYRYLLALYKYYDDLTTLKANFISDFGGEP